MAQDNDDGCSNWLAGSARHTSLFGGRLLFAQSVMFLATMLENLTHSRWIGWRWILGPVLGNGSIRFLWFAQQQQKPILDKNVKKLWNFKEQSSQQ